MTRTGRTEASSPRQASNQQSSKELYDKAPHARRLHQSKLLTALAATRNDNVIVKQSCSPCIHSSLFYSRHQDRFRKRSYPFGQVPNDFPSAPTFSSRAASGKQSVSVRNCFSGHSSMEQSCIAAIIYQAVGILIRRFPEVRPKVIKASEWNMK